MYPVKQSTALTIPIFVHDSNGDAITGMTDGDFTKRISKNGGAFAAMTVTITEMENGWYSVPLSTSHTDTLGILSMSFIEAGSPTLSAKQVNIQLRVHANLPDDLPTAAEVNAEVVDALTVDTYGEAASVPAATASLKDKIVWLATLARNKITQSATTESLRNDADSGNIATSTVSDDGSTFTRGEWT